MLATAMKEPFLRTHMISALIAMIGFSMKEKAVFAFVSPNIGRSATPFATWRQTENMYAPISSVSLASNRFNRDFDELSRRRVQPGAGEVAAGAILGGLVMGPFGALFGAQLGASLGSARALDRARKEEMERLGVTEDMLDMAQECGVALERAIEGLKATRDSLETQQRFARTLDNDVERLYEKAKIAMNESKEEDARKYLLERHEKQERLKKALLSCAEEKKRLETMERNVEVLEQRAIEVEALLSRSVGAKALQATSTDFSLSREDPLLQKFRDMGID